MRLRRLNLSTVDRLHALVKKRATCGHRPLVFIIDKFPQPTIVVNKRPPTPAKRLINEAFIRHQYNKYSQKK